MGAESEATYRPVPPIALLGDGEWIDRLFASADDVAEYLEWPAQFDGEPAEAYDANGRRLTVTIQPESGALSVDISAPADPARLEAMLRDIAADRPIRFGLLDADVDLPVLLRALWPALRWGKGGYPTE